MSTERRSGLDQRHVVDMTALDGAVNPVNRLKPGPCTFESRERSALSQRGDIKAVNSLVMANDDIALLGAGSGFPPPRLTGRSVTTSERADHALVKQLAASSLVREDDGPDVFTRVVGHQSGRWC
jgi:hypothetical protein